MRFVSLGLGLGAVALLSFAAACSSDGDSPAGEGASSSSGASGSSSSGGASSSSGGSSGGSSSGGSSSGGSSSGGSSSGGVDPNDPGPAPTRTCAINKNASGYFKLQSPAGEYWARLPNGYDPKAPAPTPLVAVLHGCGDNAQNFLEWGAVPPEVHNTHTYIAIAIENAAKNCWAAADEPRVLAAIDDVAECFWVHRKKVTLGGYSSGGVTAYTVALKNASRFDGLLAYKTGLPGGADALIAGAAWKFPIVHFAATGDGSFNITKVRQDWQKLKDAGFTVETIEKPGDHNGSADDWRIHLLPKAAPWKAP